MKNLATSILTNLSIITIVITAFGIIINNIYIAQFNISDYNLLQSRSIYIGFIFSIFLLAHLVFYLALIDTKNILENTYFEIFYKTAFKLVLVTNFLFCILNLDIINQNLVDANFIERIITQTGFLSFIFIIGLYGTNYSIYKTDTKHVGSKWTFKYPLIFFIILGCISFIYYIFSFTEFKNIFYYELYFAFLFFMTLSGIWATQRDENKGIKFLDASFFTNQNKDREFWLEKIFLFIYVVGMTLVFLFNYSNRIYPLLDAKYGGGQPKPVILSYKEEKIEGMLIYQDIQNFYLLKDSSILFLKKGNVDKIYIDKTLHPTTNIVHLADSTNNENDSIK